jgi:hypothetical protein
MSESLTIPLDPAAAAQLRRMAAESGEPVESLAARLLEVAALMTAEEPWSSLTEEQLADLRERVKNPGPFATDEEVDAFFAQLRAR